MFLKGREREKKSKLVEGSNTIFLNNYVFFHHLLFFSPQLRSLPVLRSRCELPLIPIPIQPAQFRIRPIVVKNVNHGLHFMEEPWRNIQHSKPTTQCRLQITANQECLPSFTCIGVV